MTLIGTTAKASQAKIAIDNKAKNGLFLVVGATLVYYSFLVIWRHEDGYKPSGDEYIAMLILVLASIYFCYRVRPGERK